MFGALADKIFFKFFTTAIIFILASPALLSAQTTLTLKVAAGQTFSVSEGGSFTYTDTNGVAPEFTLPVDFYTENLQLQIVSHGSSEISSSKPAPSAKSFAGRVYDFDFFTLNAVSVSTLDKSVTMVLNYLDADISGLAESTIAPYRWNGSSWALVSGFTLDAANNKITFSTANFSSFALFGEEPAAEEEETTTTSDSGGGGGGGGGSAPYIPLQTGTDNLIFKGRAYPFANITILKDGSVLKTLTADSSGNYTATAKAAGGIYTFSIYAIDSQNRKSLTTSFTQNISGDKTTTFSDIVVSPTISADKSQVKLGNDIQFYGHAYPQSQINVTINSGHEIYATTSADILGSWLYKINSGILEKGEHAARSQSVALDGMISPFSESLSFRVGDSDIAFGFPARRPAAVERAINGDINGDSKTNIVDFSIMLFFWNQRNPSNPAADLNGDGIVNLFDFSIMLFWWTG